MEGASFQYGMGGGQTVERVKFSQETLDWLARQEKKADKPHTNARVFTASEDEKILAAWPVMERKKLAAALGICTDTLLRRYRELTSK